MDNVILTNCLFFCVCFLLEVKTSRGLLNVIAEIRSFTIALRVFVVNIRSMIMSIGLCWLNKVKSRRFWLWKFGENADRLYLCTVFHGIRFKVRRLRVVMTGNFFFIYICRIVCESGVGYEVWHCSAVDNGKVFYGLRSSVITQIIGECGFVERLACLYFLSKKCATFVLVFRRCIFGRIV